MEELTEILKECRDKVGSHGSGEFSTDDFIRKAFSAGILQGISLAEGAVNEIEPNDKIANYFKKQTLDNLKKIKEGLR